MLTTCDKCLKAHYCINCAKRDGCFWLTVAPPQRTGSGYPAKHLSAYGMSSAVSCG